MFGENRQNGVIQRHPRNRPTNKNGNICFRFFDLKIWGKRLLKERGATLNLASLRGHGDRIEVRTADKNVNPMLGAILEAGGQVLSVTPHRVSLESIFLSAVEQDRADEKERER